MLFRRRALTLAVMTSLFFIAASLVTVFIYASHGWYESEPIVWSQLRPAFELMRGLGIAAYSGLLALVLGPALIWTLPVWSFRVGAQRRAIWR